MQFIIILFLWVLPTPTNFFEKKVGQKTLYYVFGIVSLFYIMRWGLFHYLLA